MSIGRIGTAPCGHRGEAVIGHYYACLEGCDTRGATPPAPLKVRLAGLPAHITRGECSCMYCIGYRGTPGYVTHPSCVCTWCAYARHVTKLQLWTGGMFYTEVAWDGTGDATWKIDAFTAMPYQIDEITALTAKSTLKVRHVLGDSFLGGPKKPPPLSNNPSKYPQTATSLELRLVILPNKIEVTFDPPPATVVVTPSTGGFIRMLVKPAGTTVGNGGTVVFPAGSVVTQP